MLRSALISVLSACLAVFTTLLYQQWFSPPPTLHQHHVISVTDSEIQQLPKLEHPSPSTINLAQALDLGRVLLSRGEHEEAVLVYRVAASAAAATVSPAAGDPGTNREHGEAQHGLGLALLATGRTEEALEACREAEQLDPGLAAASSCVGSILVDVGDIGGALTALRHAAEKADGEGGAAGVLGEVEGTADATRGRYGAALLAAGEVDEAIAVLTSVELKTRRAGAGGDPHTAYNLGVAWQTKGETDKAIVAYSRAADLAPTLAAPRVNLGAQLLQSGRLPEAEAVLLSAVELARDDPPSLAAAHANLGAVLQRSGRPDQALDSYSQAVQSGAGRPSLMHIAKLHQELGQPDQALEACRRAMLEDGGLLDTSPLLMAGLILENLGNVEEAADHFAKVVQQDADNLEATMHLGTCQQRLGRHHEALASFLAASLLEPENPAIYDLLLSTVREAKRATGEVADDDVAGNVDGGNSWPERQAVVDAFDNGTSPGRVAEQPEETESVGAERAGQRPVAKDDGFTADEADRLTQTKGSLEEQASLDPNVLRAAEGGGERHGEGSEVGFAAEAAAAAAETDRSEDVGRGSSSGRSGVHVLPVGNVAKGAGVGTGASVRQDSAEMRRLSESLRDDGAGSTTTRGFFGKQVPEGSKHPAVTTNPAAAATVPTTLAGLGGEGGAGAGGGAAASTAAADMADGILTSDDSPPDGIVGVQASEETGGSLVPEHARSVGAGQVYGGAASVGEKSNFDSGGLAMSAEEVHAPTTTASGSGMETSVPVEAASLDSGEVEEALAVGRGDKTGLGVAADSADKGTGGAVERGERLVVPPASAEPLPSGNGTAESATEVDLKEAVGDASDTLDTKAESSSQQGKGEQGGTAVPGLNDAIEEEAEVEEGQLNGTTVAVTDAERGFASPLFKGANGEQAMGEADDADKEESDGSMGTVEEDDGGGVHNLFEGNEMASAYPAGDVDRPAVPSTVGADDEVVVGEGDGFTVRLDNGNSFGLGDDAATPTRISVDAVPGVAVDEEAMRAAEERVVVQGETEETENPGDLSVEEGVDGLAAPHVAGDSTVGSTVAVEQQSEEINLPPTTADTPGGMGDPASEVSSGSGSSTTNEGAAEQAREPDDAVEEHALDATEAEAGAAADGMDETASSSSRSSGDSSRGDGDAPATEAPKGLEGGEAVTGSADSADATAKVPAVPVAVSEDDAKRARAKAKLGVAKLQQGQAKKAVSLFEKAASIDPGWWGGFYYAALAHDALGNAEAAAGALVSALGATAPTEEGEIAGLATLSSKVLATLDGGKQERMADILKTAMDTSGLTFASAPPAHDRPLRGNSGVSGENDSVAPQGMRVGDRTASMGGKRGVEGASSGGAASRGGLEADLADRFGQGGGARAAPSAKGGKREGLENTNSRWPYSGQGGLADAGGSGGGRPAGGEDGANPGSNRGTMPEMVQQGQTPADLRGLQQDTGRTGEAGGGGGWLRDGGGAGGGGGRGRDNPSKQDVGHRRRRGRSGQGGEGGGSSGAAAAAAAAAARGSGEDVGSPMVIDSKASTEEILASMGLKSGDGFAPDRLSAGGGARTPEDMMADAASGGADGGNQRGKKKGLFSRIWNRKDERNET